MTVTFRVRHLSRIGSLTAGMQVVDTFAVSVPTLSTVNAVASLCTDQGRIICGTLAAFGKPAKIIVIDPKAPSHVATYSPSLTGIASIVGIVSNRTGYYILTRTPVESSFDWNIWQLTRAGVRTRLVTTVSASDSRRKGLDFDGVNLISSKTDQELAPSIGFTDMEIWHSKGGSKIGGQESLPYSATEAPGVTFDGHGAMFYWDPVLNASRGFIRLYRFGGFQLGAVSQTGFTSRETGDVGAIYMDGRNVYDCKVT